MYELTNEYKAVSIGSIYTAYKLLYYNTQIKNLVDSGARMRST